MINSPLRWHGGKSLLRSKHLTLFPKKYERFVDACCGAMWMLFALPQHQGVSEYANDLDGFVWNFWKCLQEKSTSDRLIKRLQMTPLSQREFERSLTRVSRLKELPTFTGADVQTAADFFVVTAMSRQGLGRDYCTPTSRTRRNINEQVSAWLSRVDLLPEVVERLSPVELLNDDIEVLIEKLDWKKTFFYIDPPYLHETRLTTKDYGLEMLTEQHESLLKRLCKAKGRFLLCGYPSKLYNRFARQQGWRLVTIRSTKHSSSKSTKPIATECCWMNY